MKSYRCSFMDRSSRVQALSHMACASDLAAITTASNMLRQNHHAAAELWRGERWVARLLYEPDPRAIADAAHAAATLQFRAHLAGGGDR